MNESQNMSCEVALVPLTPRRAVWINALTRETDRQLSRQPGTVFQSMSREFESALIRRALRATGGCRIDAAHLLGIGRNTITRKIREFNLEVETIEG
jgi:two-component system nitrogen regulation response regulator GlnG